MSNKGINAEAADKLASALEPLQGHAPEDSRPEEVQLRMKSAQETPVRTPPRAAAVSVADFQNANLTGGYPFGLASTAAGLRKLADAVESGRVNPQRVTILQEGDLDDFHKTTLSFTYNDIQGART